jgi:hypothetical protein
LCTVWRSPSPQTNIYRQSIVIAVGRLALICPSEIVTVGYLKETIQPRLPTESLPVLADAFMAKIIRPVLKANNHLLVGDFDKFPASINQWISAPEEANDSVGWMDRNSASDVLICRMDQLLSLVNSWRPADTRLSVICQQLMVTISKQIAV